MHQLRALITESIQYIRQKTLSSPRYGLVLGTGLGNLVQEINIDASIDYTEIPHFPVSTVESHRGRLIFGRLAGKEVVAMQGRFHYYEGYTMQQVTFPVRVMKFLGVETLLLSNASGGINPHFRTGDLMILNDHINLLPEHPLRGRNDDSLGPRFPDMLHTYDRDLIDKALAIAKAANITCHQGVYVSVQGPCLETPAEYRFFHIAGGDAVGMSTVPEVIVARHMGMKVFAISVITDMGFPKELIRETTLDDVIRVAKATEPKMTFILKKLIESL